MMISFNFASAFNLQGHYLVSLYLYQKWQMKKLWPFKLNVVAVCCTFNSLIQLKFSKQLLISTVVTALRVNGSLTLVAKKCWICPIRAGLQATGILLWLPLYNCTDRWNPITWSQAWWSVSLEEEACHWESEPTCGCLFIFSNTEQEANRLTGGPPDLLVLHPWMIHRHHM